MFITHHAEYRMQERVIDPRIAALAMTYGKKTANHMKKMLRVNDIPPMVYKSLDSRMKKLVEKQLPIVVWTNNNVLITAARVGNKRVNMRPSSMQIRVSANTGRHDF